MRKALVIGLLLACAVTLSVSAQAVVKEFSGKVEMKAAGGDWKPVALQMVIPKGASVSTGFDAKLVLSIGNTTLTVRPLTRMLLEEIIKKENTQTTSLVLTVGKVRADVKSAEGERQDFKVKGPASTAAVRGTVFDYDGFELVVEQGVVQFFNLLNQAQPVAAGEQSSTDGYTRPVAPVQGKLSESVISTDTSDVASTGTGGGAGTGAGAGAAVATTGTLTVTWSVGQ